MENSGKKYQIDTEENKMFLGELQKNLLNFGKGFLSPGGSAYFLGDDGTPWKDRNRETWITCRMVHVYSMGIMLGDKESPALVHGAVHGLLEELKDRENGGWYPGITPDNKFLPDKQCYAHAFVLLAASSALLAGEKDAETLLKDALELFDKRFWDEKQGLTYDTWNTEFTVLDDYRGLNANMHTVEAFLAVADAIKEEKYRIRAGRIIDHVIGWASANDWRIPEHFTKEWKADLDCNKERPADRFKPYGATPGHGIEWARLIVQWAYSSYKDTPDSAEVYLKAAEKLYTHKQKYAKDYEEFMRYLDDKVLDHKNGSWFHQLDENNNVIGTVWPGKSDVYHAFQSTWIPYGTPYISIASDVKQYMEVCHQ